MTLGEPGEERQGGEEADSQLVLVFPQPFQSSHELCPWGWVTLDRSLTLFGPQCAFTQKAKVELGDPKALHSTGRGLVWAGRACRKQMACLSQGN